jgi:ELWxxDGT repeat protein
VFVSGSQALTRSDLTPTGTWQIDPAVPHFRGLVGSVGDRVLYAHASVSGWDIRSTDGLGGGSTVVLQTPSEVASTRWNGVLWLWRPWMDASPLWVTDGTLGGSSIVTTLPVGVSIDRLRPAADGMYFVGVDSVEGAELWRCTGVGGGTTRVVTLFSGVRSGVRNVWPIGTGHRLFVAGGDDATGCEPYVTDGTQAGTMLLGDLAPGARSSNPEYLGVAGTRLFFVADDGIVGREPWVVDLATLGAAHAQTLWGACSGSVARPRLATLAAPRVGAAGFGFVADRVLPGAAVVLAKGTAVAPVSFGACTVLPGGTVVTLAGVADASGASSFALPVPASPALVGWTMVAQAGAVDAGGAGPGFATSDALRIVIGW